MKTLRTILTDIIPPLAVLLLTPAVTVVGSEIATGDWRSWFASIPVEAWIVVLVALLLWFLAIAVRRRRQQIRARQPRIALRLEPQFGWRVIGETSYAGVTWTIRVPVRPGSNECAPDDLDVALPPRCPECGTELEQSERFWGGVVWLCAACGFKKLNRADYAREAERVRKIERRKYEAHLAETNREH